jgi:hypothetical protein
MHTHLVGPTGSGKSMLLVQMALDDLGQSVGVAPWMDPKDGEAADTLLARIPDAWADRTVLFDPTRLDYAVGLNVLECDSPERRDVVVDQILSVFAALFADVWRQRQAEIMYMGLTTLMHHEGATLCDLPRLLTDAEQRRYWVSTLKDPDLQAFWKRYETFAPGDVAPLLGRLQSLLLRPRVRNILGQRKSTVDLAEILDKGGIVIARLPLELAATSQLLGSFLFLRCWQVIQGRQRRSGELRDAAAYLDEGELFMHIRGSVAGVFDQARGLRWGIVFAHQRMGQLPKDMAEALEVNALTKVIFRATTLDNAKAVAGLVHPISPETLRGSDPGAFQAPAAAPRARRPCPQEVGPLSAEDRRRPPRQWPRPSQSGALVAVHKHEVHEHEIHHRRFVTSAGFPLEPRPRSEKTSWRAPGIRRS